jgi:hypothetical protein
MRKLTLCTLTVLLLSATSVLALEKNDEDALKDTQSLLSDQAAMNAFAKDNKDATHALDQVNELTRRNRQQQAEVNDISSSIFSDIVKQNNGDTVAIQAKLQQALKDPKGFMNSLSPEQQARIHSLAGQLDQQNGTGNGAGAGSVSPSQMQQFQNMQSMANDAAKQSAGNRIPSSADNK